MLEILRVTFPFFALVLCGYAAARLRFLPLEAIPGLNGFVLFFALPCMLFRFGSDTPIAQLLDAGVFFTYLFCALVIVAFSIAISMNARIRWNDASLGALVAAFPNTGFMGVPLLVALLGAQAVGPAIVTIVVDLVITSSLCVALSRMDAAGEHGAAVAARKALAGVLRNPMPWAISLGAAFSFWSLELIGPVSKTVSLLADAEAATRRDAAYALLDMTNAAALPALTSALGVDFGESEEGSYTISIHARIVRRALAVHAKHPSAGELWTKGVASPYAQVRFLALVGQQQGSS